METIKIKYFSDKIEKLTYIAGKSDWIDLRAAEDIVMKQGEFKLIPLGIAMELPKGYEAHVIPRSSTFKNFGLLQTNSCGLIDESYCGDNDQWFFPALAMRDTEIHVNDRICQFRIMEHQPQIIFEETEKLDGKDRGGFVHGSGSLCEDAIYRNTLSRFYNNSLTDLYLLYRNLHFLSIP